MIVKDLSNSFNPVPKPKFKENKRKTKEKGTKSKEIKKKSSKLAKLERDRFSIITKDFSKCYICQIETEDLEKHEVFAGRNRQTSMKFGLVIPVCQKCHEKIPKTKTLNQNLHKIGQKAFEKKHKNENFIKLFGKNYL